MHLSLNTHNTLSTIIFFLWAKPSLPVLIPSFVASCLSSLLSAYDMQVLVSSLNSRPGVVGFAHWVGTGRFVFGGDLDRNGRFVVVVFLSASVCWWGGSRGIGIVPVSLLVFRNLGVGCSSAFGEMRSPVLFIRIVVPWCSVSGSAK